MVEIILMAMIAAFILLRLRGELGKRPEDDRQQGGNTGQGSDHQSGRYGGQLGGEVGQDDGTSVVDMSADPAVRAGLKNIRSADRSFDSTQFLDGAKQAYRMILEAFWSGDRETLKTFLADTVLSQFVAAIDARESAGQTMDNRLLDIEYARLIAARLDGNDAEIGVSFTADLISVTRDANGTVVAGNVSDSVNVTDEWTFQRNVRSSEPNWLLVGTRSA